MARNASTTPDSGSAQSPATIGFDLSAAKDHMVALPGQLFYSTQLPVCLWFLAKNKAADAKRSFRDRHEMKKQLALAA
jgi:type I restriction-modification system DNA methylase subunit